MTTWSPEKESTPSAARASPAKVVERGARFGRLDSVRGYAALSVFIVHYGGRPLEPMLANFGAGVIVFFVLSGFLLYLPVAFWVNGEPSRPRLGPFIRNRALRIFPAYSVVTIVVLLVGYRQYWVYAEPAHLLPLLSLTSAYVGLVPLVEPAWSLSPELAFYVLLAGLITVMAPRSRRLLVAFPLSLAVIGVASLAVFGIRHIPFASIVYTPGAVLHSWLFFGVGMLTAVYVVAVGDRKIDPRHQSWLLGGAALAFALSFPARGVSFEVADALVGAGAVALLVAVTVPPRTIPPIARAVIGALDWAPARALGRISYSFYLVHQPVLFLVVPALAGAIGVVSHGVAAVVAVMLSIACFLLVERPALSMKKRWH